MTDLTTPARFIVLTAWCIAFAGCGSQVHSGDSGAAGEDASQAVPAGNPTATAIDACSLLSAEDVSALLGVMVEGKSTTTDPRLPGCLWENPENYESVSLEIGNSRTAVNNTLPPPEPGFPDVGTPGPDGMRFLGSGLVEFAAGGRSNTVQVAVLALSGDEADDAAVELARKVAPQIPE